ncbi:murein biosynthesis integral membrane protein MurJ [Prosthecomicrobium sp. N25]|uniref:murein biosynthesis integral membrane protein MurJ n=1 Tax=Prosthecomicrobium sp. N25 TaxID=3129254 RepID=UPI0030788FA3
MSLVRNFMSVGAATLASRVLGFLRDTLIAAALGTGPVADAFVVAFRLPNLFRRLFAEGAFNAAFVPLYARVLEAEGEGGARRFAADVLAVLLVAVLAFSGLAMLAAPGLVWVLAPGFAADPEKFGLATLLTRICFPYLAAMALIALMGGILNAHRRFLAAALAPVLLNLVLIAALLAALSAGLARTREAGIWLAAGVSLAGLAQLALVTVAVSRAGWAPRLVRPRWTPSVARLLRLAVPGAIAGGIAEINIVVGTMIASLSAGSVAFLYYADRVYQLPLGLVGVAVGTVLLPEIARQLRADREDLALAAQNRSLEFAAVLTLPAAVALVVAAQPIVEVLFERGAFGPQDTQATAEALLGFGYGLPAFVFVKVFAPGFFAREDTRTPMVVGAVSVAVNVALSLALYPVFEHVAIALATSAAGWVNALLLWGLLVRRGHWRADGELEHRLPRIAGAAAAMGVVVWLLADLLEGWTGAENPLPVKLGALALLCGSGFVVFFALAHLMGGVDLRRLRALVARERTAAAE